MQAEKREEVVKTESDAEDTFTRNKLEVPCGSQQ